MVAIVTDHYNKDQTQLSWVNDQFHENFLQQWTMNNLLSWGGKQQWQWKCYQRGAMILSQFKNHYPTYSNIVQDLLSVGQCDASLAWRLSVLTDKESLQFRLIWGAGWKLRGSTWDLFMSKITTFLGFYNGHYVFIQDKSLAFLVLLYLSSGN